MRVFCCGLPAGAPFPRRKPFVIPACQIVMHWGWSRGFSIRATRALRVGLLQLPPLERGGVEANRISVRRRHIHEWVVVAHNRYHLPPDKTPRIAKLTVFG